MNHNIKVLFFLLLFIFFIVPSHTVAGENRRDGNWWRGEDKYARITYVTGFFDGMDLGHRFSYWEFTNKKELEDCIYKVITSYDNFCDKYFKNVTNGQIVDGLDSFYADFRNRSIVVHSAVWVVVNSIAGTPKKTIDALIENLRRNAKIEN